MVFKSAAVLIIFSAEDIGSFYWRYPYDKRWWLNEGLVCWLVLVVVIAAAQALNSQKQ